jgi:hypothetical protein
LIVPLYIWPGAQWDAIIEAKRTNPNTPMTAIINPSSGPGDGPVEPIRAGVKKFEKAGISSVGYVPTGHGRAEPRSARSSIDKYREWYGLDGIFLDEVSSGRANSEYYLALTAYARSVGIKTCIGNPGQRVSPEYHDIFDTLIVFEGPHLLSPSTMSMLAPGAPKGSIAAIMYAVPVLDTAYVETLAKSFGQVYVTEIGPPDPYKALPGYFSTMCRMIERANAGGPTGRNLVTVLTLDHHGVPISGIPVRAESMNLGLIEGHSPFTFEFPDGAEVGFTIDENAGLDHWLGGDTSRSLRLSIVQDRVITAYCRPTRT